MTVMPPRDQPSTGATWRAWAEITRISNLPTVISNVLLGLGLGRVAGQAIDPFTIAMVTGGIALLYLGGMVMNDVVDAEIDAKERPERPIPSGRISKSTGVHAAWIMLLLGATAFAAISLTSVIFAAVLLGTIMAYDMIHKKAAWSILLMGACRGLVYLTVASAIAWPLTRSPDTIVMALCMTGYIVILTSIARMEPYDSAGKRKAFAFVLPMIVVIPMLVVKDWDLMWATGGALAAVMWILIAARHLWEGPLGTRAAVMGWLAGICLIDAFYLLLIQDLPLAAGAAACFVVTVAGHRTVAGS